MCIPEHSFVANFLNSSFIRELNLRICRRASFRMVKYEDQTLK